MRKPRKYGPYSRKYMRKLHRFNHGLLTLSNEKNAIASPYKMQAKVG